MLKERWKGNLLLLLTAFIWGCAFVAQRVAMDAIGPFTFGALRFALAAWTLLPVLGLRSILRRRIPNGLSMDRRRTAAAGLMCGVLLFLASSAQQIGLLYTTVGKSGFITALYIVLVPVGG